MFTTFTALALAGGALRLVLQWQLTQTLGHLTGSPTGTRRGPCGACWLAEHLQPFPFPVPLSLTLGLLLPDLLLRRA